MSSTMLQLIQQMTGELGISVPTYVAGNTATDTVQQLALLNAVGYELQQQYDWEHAVTAYRFTTAYVATTGNTVSGSAVVTNIPTTAAITAGTFMPIGAGINSDVYVDSVDSLTQVTLSQPCTATGTAVTINFCKTKYAFPSDYDRPINRTQWDKTKHWEMLGPVTAQQWELLKSGYISTGPRMRYRALGGTFQIWPPTASNEYLGFEYMSKNWAYDAGGAAKSAFTVDTDTCVYPDRLMVLGLKLKYFEIKGFDTTAINRDYTAQVSIAKAANGGAQTLSMAPRLNQILIGPDQIPDTNFGS
jgi:hypothetical protein